MTVVDSINKKPDHGPINARKLADIIEQAYLEFRKSGFKQKQSFSPSKIGYGEGQCPRYWVIAFRGAEWEDKSDALGIAKMQVGTEAHDRLGRLLQRSSLNIKALEQKLEHDDPPVFGYIDVIIDRAGEDVIGEIKTARSESWTHRQAKSDAPDYHMVQLLLYLELYDAEHGFFLYENKNDQRIIPVPIKRSDHQDYIDRVISWMRDVYQAYQDDKLPERKFRANSRVCKNCPFQTECYDGLGKGDISIERLPSM